MPRVGKHPLKTKSFVPEVTYKDITVSTIVYIPSLEGYWREALEILKLFFNSLYQNTTIPFDLMVFDNGSCSEVRNYLTELHDRGKIQYLIFSEQNLRKLGALDFLLSAAPGEYIAYADSDVYFLPGWLEKSLEILKTFPQAGMVSAIPTADKLEWYLDSTIQGIENDPEIEIIRGNNIIPNEFIKAHQLSLGKSQDTYVNVVSEQTLISRKNVQAFISAQDFQFTTTKAVIKKVLPLHIETLDEVYDPIYSPVFERKVDAFGYWRLSTSSYLVHHMGNHVPDLAEELKEIAKGVDFDYLEKKAEEPVHKAELRNRFYKSHSVRKLMKKIYTWSYRILFEE